MYRMEKTQQLLRRESERGLAKKENVKKHFLLPTGVVLSEKERKPI